MVAEVVEMTKQLCTTGAVDDLLVEVVDETLREVFREEGAKVIYTFIKNSCHLRREEIAEKPKVFSSGLEELLGSAAQVIERLILDNLYSRLRLEYKEMEGYEFSDYAKELRKAAVVKR
jgi:hypothetical protein